MYIMHIFITRAQKEMLLVPMGNPMSRRYVWETSMRKMRCLRGGREMYTKKSLRKIEWKLGKKMLGKELIDEYVVTPDFNNHIPGKLKKTDTEQFNAASKQ